MASHAARGKKALDSKNYPEAISAYTDAITDSPSSADYFIQRSTAYQRCQKNAEALNDADQAVINAQARSKLELIVEAQFRRGVALFSLGRYADAKFLLEFVRRKNEKHKMAEMWIGKADMKLKSLPEDDPARKCTVSEKPDPPSQVKPETSTADTKEASNDTVATDLSKPHRTTSPTSTRESLPTEPTPPAAPQQTPANKIRYDWYQNNENVFFTLMAKGVPQTAQVDISERALNISFPLQSGSTYELSLDPLFAAVNPTNSISRVFSTKVEVVLSKTVAGQKWTSIESSEPIDTPKATRDSPQDGEVRKAVSSPALKDSAPAYPTSSKSGPKNWDSITADLSNEDGKGGDDDEEGADGFFKKLFKGASPDAQRAMMKSYTESNGTSLSTNWEEVSKGPVETLPPDGMEAKKW